MNNELSPICLFTYNRLNELKRTVESLKRNTLARESELFIFSDGAKSGGAVQKVENVRKYLKTIHGFKTVTIVESPNNKGLAESIITGITEVISKYGKVIVLEDDLITSPNFLDFMNQALVSYEKNDKIFSISGYTFNLSTLQKDYSNDYYAGVRASSWGWGTWLHEWENVDWEVKGYHSFKWSIPKQLKFMKGGSDMPRMLKRQMNGQIDSWAIRWCYYQFLKNKLTIFPSISKVKSIGFDSNATHTFGNEKRFDTPLDLGLQREFFFDEEVKIDKQLVREFKRNFSVWKRLLGKFK